MSYIHIPDLYKDRSILLFRECYALEKAHGTSASISWIDAQARYHSGGVESHHQFLNLFDHVALERTFRNLVGHESGHKRVDVFGEAYGGKQQGMNEIYGDELRFIVFDVRINGLWLAVPQMQNVAESLGLEVVPWVKTSTDVEAIDAARDMQSMIASRRGREGKKREGVVLRPLIELTKNNGERVIAKHRLREYQERSTYQEVTDTARIQVLSDAEAIANEWVTEMRMTHVLGRFSSYNIRSSRAVIDAMLEDVLREAEGEIIDSKEARAAIGRKTAQLFVDRLRSQGEKP